MTGEYRTGRFVASRCTHRPDHGTKPPDRSDGRGVPLIGIPTATSIPMTALTHELLRDYANAFHTYGDFDSPVWFLGLEEGGGRDLDEAGRKLTSWHGNGRRSNGSFTDPGLDADHAASRFLRTEGKPAELQKTWANQLRVLLGMRGEPLDNDRVRHLQTREHGRIGGPTCLMELFPLPCRNAGAWIYGDVPHDPAANEPNVFATKKAYRDHYLPKRLAMIAALVEEHRPAALICTVWTHRGPFLELLDGASEFEMAGAQRRAVVGRLHDTVVAVCSHPADQVRGPCNAFYHALGRAVAERLPPHADQKMAA